MTLSNSEVKLYTDILIADALLSESSGLTKQAQMSFASGLISSVEHYFSNHINPNNKVNSFLNIIAPGAISVAFKGLGLGWLGFLFGICINFFHIDVAGIIESIWTSLKSELGGGKLMDSSQVDGIVNSAIDAHATPATQEEADRAEKTIQVKSQDIKLRDVKLLKLAMIDFARIERGLIKTSGFLDIFKSKKAATATILSRVLSLFFKVGLASAGLMVAGDVISKFMGRPNALDNTRQEGKTPEEPTNVPVATSKQTKFKVSPSYHDTAQRGWTENVPNTKEGVQNMVLRFAKEVYPELNGLDSIIEGTAGFQVIVDNILWHNHTAPGSPVVFIPNMFSSKKMMVDHFIDDVAEKAP